MKKLLLTLTLLTAISAVAKCQETTTNATDSVHFVSLPNNPFTEFALMQDITEARISLDMPHMLTLTDFNPNNHGAH